MYLGYLHNCQKFCLNYVSSDLVKLFYIKKKLISVSRYTLGGFDGDSYVSKVEYLDTRMGSWVEAEPMNVARGYFGSFVMEDKLYAIGGVKEEAQQLDIVCNRINTFLNKMHPLMFNVSPNYLIIILSG